MHCDPPHLSGDVHEAPVDQVKLRPLCLIGWLRAIECEQRKHLVARDLKLPDELADRSVQVDQSLLRRLTLEWQPMFCEHTFVPADEGKLAVLDAAIACQPAALRFEPKDREAVEWLARAGLLIDAGDGTVTPTRAAVHYDELVKP